MLEPNVRRSPDRKIWVAPVVAVGLAVLAGASGILGWFMGDAGKLSESEALGTANAVSASCDATQAAKQQEINDLNVEVGGWKASSDNWGRTAEAAIAQLTQIAQGTPVVIEVTQQKEVTRVVTVEVTPTGLKCYIPATAAARTSTATATATRTATGTMEPTLALRNTDTLTPINTIPAPTNTNIAPTPAATNTEVIPTATEQIPPTATAPIPTPAPTNTDVIPTATISTP